MCVLDGIKFTENYRDIIFQAMIWVRENSGEVEQGPHPMDVAPVVVLGKCAQSESRNAAPFLGVN